MKLPYTATNLVDYILDLGRNIIRKRYFPDGFPYPTQEIILFPLEIFNLSWQLNTLAQQDGQYYVGMKRNGTPTHDNPLFLRKGCFPLGKIYYPQLQHGNLPGDNFGDVLNREFGVPHDIQSVNGASITGDNFWWCRAFENGNVWWTGHCWDVPKGSKAYTLKYPLNIIQAGATLQWSVGNSECFVDIPNGNTALWNASNKLTATLINYTNIANDLLYFMVKAFNWKPYEELTITISMYWLLCVWITNEYNKMGWLDDHNEDGIMFKY